MTEIRGMTHLITGPVYLNRVTGIGRHRRLRCLTICSRVVDGIRKFLTEAVLNFLFQVTEEFIHLVLRRFQIIHRTRYRLVGEADDSILRLENIIPVEQEAQPLDQLFTERQDLVEYPRYEFTNLGQSVYHPRVRVARQLHDEMDSVLQHLVCPIPSGFYMAF